MQIQKSLLLLAPAVLTAAAASGQTSGESSSLTQPANVDLSGRSTYLVSEKPFFETPDLLWDGFLTGLEGFEHHYEPISNPLYNESPFIETQLKVLYIHHEFPDNNAIAGGDADIAAVQARLAITERLAFIANKDGYTWLDSGLTGEQEGFNDLAVGLKYAFIADRESDFVLTGGARYMWRVGAQRVLMGTAEELSPFISAAKGFDKFHLEGNATYRIGIDEGDTNDIFQWSLHADYEIADGIAPVIEINGLHYLSNGNRLPVNTGGLDYANIGAANVKGDSVVWAGLGAAFKLNPNVELGATYEFPFTDPDNDLIESRVTVGLTLSF